MGNLQRYSYRSLVKITVVKPKKIPLYYGLYEWGYEADLKTASFFLDIPTEEYECQEEEARQLMQNSYWKNYFRNSSIQVRTEEIYVSFRYINLEGTGRELKSQGLTRVVFGAYIQDVIAYKKSYNFVWKI